GYQFALPAEAQLEFAFRGGTETAFLSGAEREGLEEYVWNSENSSKQTHPVKSKRANAFGVHQSSVREWTMDWYRDFFPTGEETDPQGPTEGTDHVIRGCGWYQYPAACRSAFRGSAGPASGAYFIGFRLLRLPKSGSPSTANG
ncbi:MAG: SUMF1/EgtB/PvdO family nonheme iron enzyme, partial [Bdellovibrionia bacterium]